MEPADVSTSSVSNAVRVGNDTRGLGSTNDMQLPYELTQEIALDVLGSYDLRGVAVGNPEPDDWDAIVTLIHVSKSFRACTIDILEPFLGGMFVNEGTK